MKCEQKFSSGNGGYYGRCGDDAVWLVEYEAHFVTKKIKLCRECTELFDFMHSDERYEILSQKALDPRLIHFE